MQFCIKYSGEFLWLTYTYHSSRDQTIITAASNPIFIYKQISNWDCKLFWKICLASYKTFPENPTIFYYWLHMKIGFGADNLNINHKSKLSA